MWLVVAEPCGGARLELGLTGCSLSSQRKSCNTEESSSKVVSLSRNWARVGVNKLVDTSEVDMVARFIDRMAS